MSRQRPTTSRNLIDADLSPATLNRFAVHADGWRTTRRNTGHRTVLLPAG